MAIKQLSAFVENKPGRLLGMVRHIADAGINMRAMSIAVNKDFGILRVIVSDVEGARRVLSEEALVSVTEVIAAGMSDRAGALYDILKVLADAGINIEYMYAFTASEDMGAYVVMRVNDNDLAERVLHESGIATLREEDIERI